MFWAPTAATYQRCKGLFPKPSGFLGIAPLHAAVCGYWLSLAAADKDGLSFAKIMRPAAVCNTEVTSTPTVCPICFRPPSTTIIVPSSR